MLTIEEINAAIVNQVTNGLKDTEFKEIDFQSTDIKEGFNRPCFYVEFPDNKTGLWNKFNKERTLETKIYYFPRDANKYKLELMEMQSYLEDIFLRYLQVTDTFYFFVDELDFDTTPDGVLMTTFQLYSIEELPDEETGELMGDIVVNMK